GEVASLGEIERLVERESLAAVAVRPTRPDVQLRALRFDGERVGIQSWCFHLEHDVLALDPGLRRTPSDRQLRLPTRVCRLFGLGPRQRVLHRVSGAEQSFEQAHKGRSLPATIRPVTASIWFYLFPLYVLGGLLLVLGVFALLGRIRGGRYLKPIVTGLMKLPLVG